MYVILTSKPGQFRTEAGADLPSVEAWDYMFGRRKLARFVIAALEGETRVKIIDESEPPAVNLVPSKFLPRFATLEEARRELQQLARPGINNVSLVRCEA